MYKLSLLNLLMSTLLWRGARGSCTRGCLKCDLSSQECLICDSPNNYVLDTHGICHQIEVPNCQFMNPDGKCAK